MMRPSQNKQHPYPVRTLTDDLQNKAVSPKNAAAPLAFPFPCWAVRARGGPTIETGKDYAWLFSSIYSSHGEGSILSR